MFSVYIIKRKFNILRFYHKYETLISDKEPPTLPPKYKLIRKIGEVHTEDLI